MKLHNRVKTTVFLLLFILLTKPSYAENWAFLERQGDCNINCLNNGVCAFDRSYPHRHKCICLIDMFEGEFCQFPVTSTTTTQEPLAATDGQLYEEDEFSEASPDFHYTEFTSPNDVQLGNPTASIGENQADEYAEFEPHNNELHHEAVISPTKNIDEFAAASVEPKTETTIDIQIDQATQATQATQTNQDIQNGYYKREYEKNDWNKPNDLDDQEEFYEDDSSWMMFKRRGNGVNKESGFFPIAYSIIILLILKFN